MHINVVKTKTEENVAEVNIDGQAIENVKSFIYLGSEFTLDNDCAKNIQRLLQKQQNMAVMMSFTSVINSEFVKMSDNNLKSGKTGRSANMT